MLARVSTYLIACAFCFALPAFGEEPTNEKLIADMKSGDPDVRYDAAMKVLLYNRNTLLANAAEVYLNCRISEEERSARLLKALTPHANKPALRGPLNIKDGELSLEFDVRRFRFVEMLNNAGALKDVPRIRYALGEAGIVVDKAQAKFDFPQLVDWVLKSNKQEYLTSLIALRNQLSKTTKPTRLELTKQLLKYMAETDPPTRRKMVEAFEKQLIENKIDYFSLPMGGTPLDANGNPRKLSTLTINRSERADLLAAQALLRHKSVGMDKVQVVNFSGPTETNPDYPSDSQPTYPASNGVQQKAGRTLGEILSDANYVELPDGTIARSRKLIQQSIFMQGDYRNCDFKNVAVPRVKTN